ncbi:hypothetical protein EBZ39_03730 [bacterium]|nr:hypothetical protein [bacterium]
MAVHDVRLCSRDDRYFEMFAAMKPYQVESTDNLPCIYRSPHPTDRATCGCIHKWKWLCEHPQRGGQCALADCNACSLYEPDDVTQPEQPTAPQGLSE